MKPKTLTEKLEAESARFKALANEMKANVYNHMTSPCRDSLPPMKPDTHRLIRDHEIRAEAYRDAARIAGGA